MLALILGKMRLLQLFFVIIGLVKGIPLMQLQGFIVLYNQWRFFVNTPHTDTPSRPTSDQSSLLSR